MFKFFKNLTGGKTITREGMESVLEQMKEHLITKNVAAEISEKLCESVAAKLEGKVIGTFRGEHHYVVYGVLEHVYLLQAQSHGLFVVTVS